MTRLLQRLIHQSARMPLAVQRGYVCTTVDEAIRKNLPTTMLHLLLAARRRRALAVTAAAAAAATLAAVAASGVESLVDRQGSRLLTASEVPTGACNRVALGPHGADALTDAPKPIA